MPKITSPILTDMTVISEGNILLSSKFEANWSSDEEFLVEADISQIDGDGKKSRLKNLSTIQDETKKLGLPFVEESPPEHSATDELKADSLITSESHGFYHEDGISRIDFESDGVSVKIKGGTNYTHKLETNPGKVLTISFIVKRPLPPQ